MEAIDRQRRAKNGDRRSHQAGIEARAQDRLAYGVERRRAAKWAATFS
jgi:hypothetical protein